MAERSYVAIDLKSFYASVECVERGLNPLTACLVVADESRTEKTICLAVSPVLKACGIAGRPRLFEVVQQVRRINAERLARAPRHVFAGSSSDAGVLETHPEYALSYVTAVPRMALYMKYSTDVYRIYLKYIAPEDIHVYSIDEVMMDVTDYLNTYQARAADLASLMIRQVLRTTGITATAGIGANLYLCKVAMDIVAKHMVPDADGVRIAELDEQSYREQLWDHRPLTDFWRVARGYAKKLEENGLYTMGDIARCSLGGPQDRYHEDLLYGLFGVNAELLIDHAWGWEPCTMADIKAYRPSSSSLSSGQVLSGPYSHEKARLIVREMSDSLALDLVDKGMVTDLVALDIGYDIENLSDPDLSHDYHGSVSVDWYGRAVPRHAHGTARLKQRTSSSERIAAAVLDLFERCTDHALTVRRITVTACQLESRSRAMNDMHAQQLDLFSDPRAEEAGRAAEQQDLEREQRAQQAILKIKRKYGKNAIIKGTDLQEGATAVQRNSQIGGHKA